MFSKIHRQFRVIIQKRSVAPDCGSDRASTRTPMGRESRRSTDASIPKARTEDVRLHIGRPRRSARLPQGPALNAYDRTLGRAARFATLPCDNRADANALLVGIDPTSIAISLAINFMMEVLLHGCDSQDMEAGMLRGSGMCHEIGTYCSSKILGICVQKAKSQCCFNSKLGRIIQEQGRPQLKSFGDGWGDVKSPNCRGVHAPGVPGARLQPHGSERIL